MGVGVPGGGGGPDDSHLGMGGGHMQQQETEEVGQRRSPHGCRGGGDTETVDLGGPFMVAALVNTG